MLMLFKQIAVIGTILTGFYALAAPRALRGFTGLEMPGGRGVTEVRAILGGLFIALGAAALIFQSTEMFLMLGFAYLGIFAARLLGMLLDSSYEKSNYISLAVEIVFGIALVL